MPTSRRGRRASAAPTSIKQEEGTVSEEAGGNLGMIDGTTEMGYLLLSPCKVVVIHGIDDNYQRLPGKWIDVALDKTDDKEEENGEECDKNISCSYCNLVLETSKNNIPKVNNPLTLNVNTAGRFRGTISDMVHPKREEMREELASYHCQKRRSDAALLMGTVLDAQDHEYVSIRSLKLLLHPETETSQNKCTITASLLITLSFPALGINHSKQPASIVPFSRRPRNGINYKPLPPSVQFLLSILRSDWGQLDKRMKSIMDHSTSSNGDKKQTPSKKVPDYFPAKLSLEELYIRMQGSSSRLDSFSKNVTYGSLQQPTANDAYPNQRHLLNLPVDILQTQIAPFLRAKSLDSLRCSCKSLHDNLQSVVPGLKLRLYKHQVTSLQWMRQREIQPVSEAIEYALLSTREDTSSMEASEDNDPIRAMTGGQSVWLCSRPVSENASQLRQQGIRINQLTGNEMRTSTEQGFLARQGARGGLLCDDPGLGKTITVLSLILTTFGISMEVDKAKRVNPALSKPDDSFSPEERIFREYWKDEITPEFRRPAMGRLLSKLKRLSPTMGFFLRPIDPKLDGCEDYLDAIETPICLNDIYKKVSKDAYGHGNADFDAFVADVELCFLNAMEYNPSDHEIHLAAKNLLKRFREELVEHFKQDQVGSVRGSVSNIAMKPNSAVAVLLQQKSQREFNSSLIKSRATLLVIPQVLMEHWEDQLKMHVNFQYCTDKIPLIYEYTPSRKSALGTEEVLRLCQVDKTHCPLVFLDKAGTQKLPSAEFLSMFSIVISTTKRFANEWKNGSFQEELQRKQADGEGDDSDRKYLSYRLMEYGTSEEEACPLLKIHFLRLIVDEGHAMGRGKGSSAIRFASWISAQRRWGMTGTPTKQTVSQNGLNNMLGLMGFLQHDFFTARSGGDKVWKTHIAKSWTDGNLASFYRLRSLLFLLMIRHTKLDIKELPPPIFETTVIPMSPLQVTTYNTLVSAVQSNLLLTSFKGSKTSGEQDSLLHRSQAKFASEVLSNIRLVCCGGTLVFPSITEKNWTEFFDLCKFKHRMDPSSIIKLEDYIHRATVREESTACSCCGMLLSTLLVLPCSCLLCTECMTNDSNVCIMCNQEFDVDDFQRLQPGFEYKWKDHDLLKAEEAAHKKEKAEAGDNSISIPNPSEEIDASREGETENAVHHVNEGQNQLLIRPPSERRRTRKPGDGHVCEYSRSFQPGKCTLCFAEHSYCKLINDRSCCETCYQEAEECPEYESKSFYLFKKLAGLFREQQKSEANFMPTFLKNSSIAADSGRHRLKVIVFSQFRKTLNVVGDRLLRGFGTAHVAEYWGTYRSSELHKFVHDPECFVMLLGKDGSEGLDLSFVTHLVFLEAVWDKSLEQQAVARAWRMGAKGPVKVETLLAKNSVEEQLWKLEQTINDDSSASPVAEAGSSYGEELQSVCLSSETASRSDYQRAKIHFCLKNLRLIPEVELVPLPPPAECDPPKRSLPVKTSSSLPPAKKKKTSPRQVRFMV